MENSWTLVFDGTGNTNDVEILARGFVETLRSNGHSVTYARQSINSQPNKDLTKSPIGAGVR